jgi:hypothetical protein
LDPLLDMAQGQLEEEWADWLDRELDYWLECWSEQALVG